MQTCSAIKTLVNKSRYLSPRSLVRLQSTSSAQNEEYQSEGVSSSQDDTKLTRRDFRYIFPEFLPDPNPQYRNTLAEKLVRKDLLARRGQVEIPGK